MRIIGTFLLAAALCAGCGKTTKDEHAGHDQHGCSRGNAKPGMCGEHGVPEAECGICNPDKIAKLKPGEGLAVRLPSAESTKIVGVETAAPTIGAVWGKPTVMASAAKANTANSRLASGPARTMAERADSGLW